MNFLTQEGNYGMSDRYQTITTGQVIEEFKQHGMVLDTVQASKTRKEGKDGFQKHLVRMSYGDDKEHGVKHQIVMFNSYDGSSSLQLQFGMFRFVCSNGLVAGEDLVEPMKIMHSNQSWKGYVHEFINNFETNLQKQRDWIDNLRIKRMSSFDIEKLCYEAMSLREVGDERKKVLDSLELQTVRRMEDRGSCAFEVFNRVQENLILGGYSKMGYHDGNPIVRKAKELKDPARLISVNSRLSELITEMV